MKIHLLQTQFIQDLHGIRPFVDAVMLMVCPLLVCLPCLPCLPVHLIYVTCVQVPTQQLLEVYGPLQALYPGVLMYSIGSTGDLDGQSYPLLVRHTVPAALAQGPYLAEVARQVQGQGRHSKLDVVFTAGQVSVADYLATNLPSFQVSRYPLIQSSKLYSNKSAQDKAVNETADKLAGSRLVMVISDTASQAGPLLSLLRAQLDPRFGRTIIGAHPLIDLDEGFNEAADGLVCAAVGYPTAEVERFYSSEIQVQFAFTLYPAWIMFPLAFPSYRRGLRHCTFSCAQQSGVFLEQCTTICSTVVWSSLQT